MKVQLIIIMLLLLSNISSKELNKVFQLIPTPQKIEVKGGNTLRYGELTYLVSSHNNELPILPPVLDALPQKEKKGKGVQLIITEEEVPSSVEGYVLRINSKGVTISSRNKAGIFYGCQTLEQLLEDSRDFNCAIPEMVITDYPVLAYRAIHFDTKHHLNRMEYYYKAIDRLARYKINAVIWELEDKLRYIRRPEIGAPNAISKEEMIALCRYAHDRNIDVSPLVQGLGHASYILKHHWELREDPNSDRDFCPADPRTYELQFDLYQDAIEAMPYGKYLHIGGDEVQSIGIDERCKATGKTPFELQMDWLQKTCKYATEHSRTPIFWDDMPLKHADLWDILQNDTLQGEELDRQWNTQKLDEAINLFPKECIYMRWKYEQAVTPIHQRLLNWYKEKGLKVMAATAAATGNSIYLPREIERTDFIKGFCKITTENDLVGILATTWDDGSPHAEAVWREFIALGEYSWNPDARDRISFSLAHGQREFGFCPADSLTEFINDLKALADFFDEALVTSGRRNPAWGVTPFTLLDMPNPNNPGKWSSDNNKKVNEAIKAIERYERIDSILNIGEKTALRNRYTLQVYRQTAHLFAFSTKVIIALHKYDMANTPEQRKQSLSEIKNLCNYFKIMRSQFENVYSEIRFMSTADGYIEEVDPNKHLSARTNNSDWMFYFEIPMVKRLEKWLSEL
ncbi:family 20 glycosylhydrolase [uncultured Parabacteroides sp.]|uniref:family 20 glycosylhydrolase n=1 Tax=uncultured Parabacteroides sp. TaxID=512312 RepID=UPI00258A7224|nr:family 20 glycosylhydrolase [uncultured Parabacteroides sp.]